VHPKPPIKWLPLAVRDPEQLAAEFYGGYDYGRWNLRAQLLMSLHISYDKLAADGVFTTDELKNKSRFLAMVHSEMHFLYFQMTEALFNMVFALAQHDERDLWLALAFSGDRHTSYYQETNRLITGFRDNQLSKPNLWEKRSVGTGLDRTEMPLIRYLFYAGYPLNLTPVQWNSNLLNIDRLLHIFATDFCDRAEYNAYKHSLGHIHMAQKFALGPEGGPMHTLGESADTTLYLERASKPETSPESGRSYWQAFRTTKFIDFERDHLCCSAIHQMIANMIVCRKYRYGKPPPDGKMQLWKALNVPFDKLAEPRTGLIRLTISA